MTNHTRIYDEKRQFLWVISHLSLTYITISFSADFKKKYFLSSDKRFTGGNRFTPNKGSNCTTYNISTASVTNAKNYGKEKAPYCIISLTDSNRDVM